MPVAPANAARQDLQSCLHRSKAARSGDYCPGEEHRYAAFHVFRRATEVEVLRMGLRALEASGNTPADLKRYQGEAIRESAGPGPLPVDSVDAKEHRPLE